MKSKSIFKRVSGTALIITAGILVSFFLNFSMLNNIIIGNEEDYDTSATKTSKLFDLFYTISSDTGYHPEPSNFNFLFTILTGIIMSVIISFKLLWQKKEVE